MTPTQIVEGKQFVAVITPEVARADILCRDCGSKCCILGNAIECPQCKKLIKFPGLKVLTS